MLPLLVIAGPTAVGKTFLGVELAARLNGEIISADSMQVYIGLDIGTAKPTRLEQTAQNGRQITHHLIDIVYPDQPFSVAEYQKLAQEVIKDICQRGKLPVLVGGTGLYIQAVVDSGRYQTPPTDPEIRKQLAQETKHLSPQELHNLVAQIDPISARKFHPNDRRRLLRALEVYRLTQRPVSAWEKTRGESPYRLKMFGLTAGRELLYQKINRRVDDMFRRGLVAEVEGLLKKGYPPDLPAMQGLGYAQVISYLKGCLTLDQARELTKRDTRHFAKRQYTWFKSDPRLNWLEVRDEQDLLAAAAAISKTWEDL